MFLLSEEPLLPRVHPGDLVWGHVSGLSRCEVSGQYQYHESISVVRSEQVVAGLYDGNVVVFDLSRKQRQHSHASSAGVTGAGGSGKHSETVWSVKWAQDNMDGHLNFYSVSSDGSVINWTVLSSYLVPNIVITVPYTGPTRTEVSYLCNNLTIFPSYLILIVIVIE